MRFKPNIALSSLTFPGLLTRPTYSRRRPLARPYANTSRCYPRPRRGPAGVATPWLRLDRRSRGETCSPHDATDRHRRRWRRAPLPLKAARVLRTARAQACTVARAARLGTSLRDSRLAFHCYKHGIRTHGRRSDVRGSTHWASLCLPMPCSCAVHARATRDARHKRASRDSKSPNRCRTVSDADSLARRVLTQRMNDVLRMQILGAQNDETPQAHAVRGFGEEVPDGQRLGASPPQNVKG